MLKKLLWLLMLAAVPSLAQTAAIQGNSFLGGVSAITSGLKSSNYLDGIIPSATITVYLTGTKTLATIYADGNNTPLANPFTSNASSSTNPGGYIFWALTGVGYDVVATGGISPNTYTTPVTLYTDVIVGGSGGGSGCAQGTCVVNNPTGTQTVVQPNGTNLNVNRFEGSLYGDQFGTGVNGIESAWSNCAVQAAGGGGCAIRIPSQYTNADNPAGWGASKYQFGAQGAGFQGPVGSSYYDMRNGIFQMTFRDPQSESPTQEEAVSIAATWDLFANQQYENIGNPDALGTHMQRMANSFNFDNYFGGMPEYVYGAYVYGQNATLDDYSGGQAWLHFDVMNKRGPGDGILTWSRLTCDAGINTSTDEGCKIADLAVQEDNVVFQGTANATTTGATTVTVTPTLGANTQGSGRTLEDVSTAKQITGNAFSGVITTLAGSQVPNGIQDATANWPVSTMIEGCYSGSDNGATGSAGCPSGSAPSGYIPGQPLTGSKTGFSPNSSVTVGVLASWSGLPSGFCTNSTLQSSNSAGSCYMPASGVGCLSDSVEYETVNYTYNSTSQQITLNNLLFPHLNGFVFSTGGLCGYAIEDLANQYTAGGTTGTIAPTYPVEGSLNATTLYYVTQRTNEGYGTPLLGGSADTSSLNGNVASPGQYGQMCFSTTMGGISLTGGVVTFSMGGTGNPLGTPFTDYNGLAVTISGTGNATYNGTYPLTLVSGNVFTYTPAAPTGTIPTTGTVAYCNQTYAIHPSAQVLSVMNGSTQAIDGTFNLMPNTMAITSGDAMREPHYQQTEILGQQITTTAFSPQQYDGAQTHAWNFQGLYAGGGVGLQVNNAVNANLYLGHGGTHQVPGATLTSTGVWGNMLNAISAPDDSLILVANCKTSYGCGNAASNFGIVSMGFTLPNAFPGYSTDSFAYNPNYDPAGRAQALTSGEWVFCNGAQNESWTTGPANGNCVGAVRSGYLFADLGVTAPNVTANTMTATALSNTPTLFLNAVGTPGSTTYTYGLVSHDRTSGGGTTLAETGLTILTGNATLSGTNYILLCAPVNPGVASYDFLKDVSGTYQSLALNVAVGNGASYSQVPNYTCVTDTGGATSAYPLPTANTTGSVDASTINSTLLVPGTNITQTIASGNAFLPIAAIASGACGTVTSYTATGAVVATDRLVTNFNSNPTGIVGYQPGAMLSIVTWLGAGQVNFLQCNNTTASITPSSLTLTWSVLR